MLRVSNRVKESTLTSGNGTVALAGAENGYQSFSSVLSSGDTTYYTIVNSNNWEVGIGTYSSNTLSRDVVLSSSNSNSRLDLNGQSYVFIAYPSEKSVYKDENDQVVAGSSGIIIGSGNPLNTSNVLYNSSGILYFNGLPVNNDPEVVEKANSLVTTVFNKTASPIPKFSVVYISGGQGDLPIVSLALANGEPKSSKTFGVTEEIIPAMGSGRVVSYGNILQVDTDAYNINAPHGDINGQVLYLSPTVSGGLTITKPYAPNHLVAVGTVIRTHQNEGVFNVRIQNGFELEELHNVATTGATSGQFIKYDGSLWKNSNLTSTDISDFSSAVSGISPNISISGTSGISVDKNGNSYTVYTTGNFGLTSSQVQQLLNSGVSINVISGTGNFNTLSVTGIPISLSGHTHFSSSIIDFNSSVSGLLPSVSGSGYVQSAFANNRYTISVTGLQPSGNYSIAGHSHLVSDITNFNTATSGLIPITGIVGSGYAIVSTINKLTSIYISGLQPSGNYSVSGHTHTSSDITDFSTSVNSLVSVKSVSGSGYVSVLATTGNYIVSVSGLQPTGNYSLVGHTHTITDITNFNSGVSGLLPFTGIFGSGYAIVNTANRVATISISGLQPSGNYSLVGHNHASSDITNFNSSVSGLLAPYALLNSGNFTTLRVNGVPVSLSGHIHTSSQITDFNSSVSGLLPSVSGSGYVQSVFSDNRYIISVNGLQPSGDYSLVGHSHLVSDISNFGSGVSGILPVKELLPGNNVTITSTSGVYTINASGGGSSVSVSDPGSGRVLVSDGTSSGIIGQSGLTFSNNSLFINGVNVNNGKNLFLWSTYR